MSTALGEDISRRFERGAELRGFDGLVVVTDDDEPTEQLELFCVEELGDAIPDRLVGSYFIG